MEKKSNLPIDPNARARIPGTTVADYTVIERKGIEVEIHRFEAGGQVFLVDLLRVLKAAPRGYFIVGRVTDDADEKKVFWSFSQEGLPKQDYYGILHHDGVSGLHFIVILKRLGLQNRDLERIIPIADLPLMAPRTIGSDVVYIGGTIPLEDLIAAKYRIAETMGISRENIRFNLFEKPVVDRQAKQEAKRRAEETAERLAAEKAKKQRNAIADQARREKQAKRREEILSRPEIEVWGKDGKKRWGIPVTEDDWQVVPKNKGVVLVKEYPADSLEIVSAFFVDKKGVKKFKKAEVFDLSLNRPLRQAEEQLKFNFIGGFLVKRDGVLVPVCETDKPNFDLMVKKGMNGNTLVAIEGGLTDAEGRRQIHEFGEGGVNVIGMFAPVQ